MVLRFFLAVTFVSAQPVLDWPQFRGPHASGAAPAKSSVPVEFGPEKNLAWKQTLPSGHSSPVVAGERVFATGFDSSNKQFQVICLSRKDGKVLWRKSVIAPQIEKVHQISSPATATPVTDGDRVYAYFASYGVAAFDAVDGKEVWSAPLAMPATMFGSGSSPVVAGDLVLINHDALKDGSLIALDRKTGKIAWETKYPAAMGRQAESCSTPVVSGDQVVLHRSMVVDSYGLKTGKRTWWAHLPTSGTSTVAIDGGTIFVAAWNTFGEADQISPLPDFAGLKQHDANGDGVISKDEMPDDLMAFKRPDAPNVPGASMAVKQYFNQLDRNSSGGIEEAEWNPVIQMMKMMRMDHGLFALRPEGEGDMTTKVVWVERTAIPEAPSPLVAGERVYIVRNGGIITCLDKASGKVVYRARVGGGGPYYSSPIAAGGRVYVASGDGVISVIEPGPELKVVARNDLKEPVFATPAVAGDLLLVRTTGALYAFRTKKQ